MFYHSKIFICEHAISIPLSTDFIMSRNIWQVNVFANRRIISFTSTSTTQHRYCNFEVALHGLRRLGCLTFTISSSYVNIPFPSRQNLSISRYKILLAAVMLSLQYDWKVLFLLILNSVGECLKVFCIIYSQYHLTYIHICSHFYAPLLLNMHTISLYHSFLSYIGFNDWIIFLVMNLSCFLD